MRLCTNTLKNLKLAEKRIISTTTATIAHLSAPAIAVARR
jgi:hypothetical protein